MTYCNLGVSVYNRFRMSVFSIDDISMMGCKHVASVDVLGVFLRSVYELAVCGR